MKQREIDALASYLRKSFKLDDCLDLVRFSDDLGVTAIRRMDIPEAGRVHWVNGGPVITLKRSLHPQRERFTWAHEIAHMILEDRVVTRGIPQRLTAFTSADDRRIEKHCDSLAATLLMPTPMVRAAIAHGLTLRAVEAVARSAEVSITAAFIRAQALSPDKKALMSYSRDRYLTVVGMARCMGVAQEYRFREVRSRRGEVEINFTAGTGRYRCELRGDEIQGVAILEHPSSRLAQRAA